jgi:hypothetical protein
MTRAALHGVLAAGAGLACLVATGGAPRAQDAGVPPSASSPPPPPRAPPPARFEPGDLESKADFQHQWQTPEPSPTLDLGGDWRATAYGVGTVDVTHDSSLSFDGDTDNRTLGRPNTLEEQPRGLASPRGTRLGIKVGDPTASRFRWMFLAEAGVRQPSVEQVYARHLFASVQTPVLDVLVGRTYDLFGWEGHGFFANSAAALGVPGEPYRQRGQLRVSHVFRLRPLDLELAGAGVVPPQSVSGVGELQLGFRVAFNGWVGAQAQGPGPPTTLPLTIGVSVLGRNFRVPPFSATPGETLTTTGGGVALDLFVPIIPVHSDDLSNALSLTIELTNGAGIADVYPGLSPDVLFPALPNPANAFPPPVYSPGVAPGLVTFDLDGSLHTIAWRSAVVGLRYQLPFARGRAAWVSLAGSRTTSSNAFALTPPFGRAFIWDHGRYWDVNLFVAIWRGLQASVSYQDTQQTFGDGTEAENHRAEGALSYYF